MTISIGMNPAPVSQQEHRPNYYNGDLTAIVANLVNRFATAEKKLELKVDGANVLSRILLTNEDVLIQADQVAVLGNVTFGDWHRDVTGKIIGGVNDTSLTQIRGGVIKTGKIFSWDQKSYVDLDGTNNEFLHSRVLASDPGAGVAYYGVDIRDDGSFIFGDTNKVGSNPYMEGTAAGLVINGAALTVGRVQGQGGTAYIDLDAAVPEFLKSSAGTYAAKINKDGSFLFGNQAKTAGTAYMEGTGAGLTVSGKALTIGKIQGNGAAYIDLDSATQFLKSSGVDIKHNGQFTLGNPAGNNVAYDGTNITLTGGKLVGNGYIDVSGTGPSGSGIYVLVNSGFSAIYGNNQNANVNAHGIYGVAIGGSGAAGTSINGNGVWGSSTNGYSGYFFGGLGVYCQGNFQATGIATVSGGLNCAGTLQATGAGRIVLNPITISNLTTMVNKTMWVDESTGLVHAT